MRLSILLLTSASAALVTAHGKVAAVTGDAGGNGTALGIKGAVVPGPGKNSVTEVDTTVFGKTKIATDGLGKTKGGGQNKVAGVQSAMAQSGSTLPQVSDGGSISGTFHIVTTDGAGPVQAMIDSTGTGAFSDGVKADVVTDVPGNKGNIKSNGVVPRTVELWALRARGLVKRASNVNKDYPVKIAVPAGTTCSGTAGGQSNVCFMKIANSNPAGPFGGVIAFQMAGASAATGNSTTAAAGTGTAAAASTSGTTGATTGTGATKAAAGGSTKSAKGATAKRFVA
ncbi:hypothetical protein P280DRAFT_37206 [Massarina eburnea CBS 473.64]|uniref:Cell surface protein n=1 Tax=Massarina eburnea CBS 473.64 TaxID=1395130 RepID=A0A6A6RGH1_9PLEO|nr:hypothetical protein P280DRAFT_37206 [Massarina eburnea CBS 473.64]